MSLSGNIGPISVIIQESPTLQSLGSTTITDLGGGLYHIDSFFDVFTQLVIEGQSAVFPDLTGPRMTLQPIIPEPAGLGLIGLAMLAARKRRR